LHDDLAVGDGITFFHTNGADNPPKAGADFDSFAVDNLAAHGQRHAVVGFGGS